MSGYDLVLIGATGYVGTAVLRHLIKGSPEISVRVLARRPPPQGAPGIRWVPCSLPQVPNGAFPPRPYWLVHLAARQIDTDGRGFVATNVTGTLNLLRKCDANLRGVVYGSSASVYGQGPLQPASELDRPDPVTPLAGSRRAAEKVILKKAAERGFGAYLCRPRFIIGGGDRFLAPILIRLARMRLAGSQAVSYSFIHVDDYAEVIRFLLRRLATQDTNRIKPERLAVNVAYSVALTQEQILSTVRRMAGLPRPLVRLRCPRSFLAGLRALPGRRPDRLATRLELLMQDQVLSCRRLSEMSCDIPSRSPQGRLEAAVREYLEVPK